MRSRNLPSVDDMELVGGRLCLDFANTANRVRGEPRDERLQSYGDVLRWGVRLGLLAPSAAERLAHTVAQSPRKGASALRRMVGLRESLWRIFATRDAAEIGNLRGTRSRISMPQFRVIRHGEVVLEPGDDLYGWLLVSVFGSAIELLTSRDLARVKSCPGHRCGWLFLDDSPTSRRKWCSMKTCGNRQKARQHYGRSIRKPAG